MPFSYDVKKEICKLKPHSRDEILAEVYGFLLFSKSSSFDNIVVATENINVSNVFCNLISKVARVHVNVNKNVLFNGKRDIITNIINQENDIKIITNIMKKFEHTFDKAVMSDDIKDKKIVCSFLRGVFLCCAAIIDPEKEYRLEFNVQNKNLAEFLVNVMLKIEQLSLNPGITQKKNSIVVYIKDSEQIYNILAFIGAAKSAMNFIQIKMVKEVRNYVNRTTNFQTANIEKTANAAAVQIAAIKKIKDTKGINYLNDDLKELALLRLDNPEMSLKELGESLSKKVSRSGVNHRLKKIIDISETL